MISWFKPPVQALPGRRCQHTDVSCHGLVRLHVSMIKQKNRELFCKINVFLARPIPTSADRPDLWVGRSGYIPTSPDLSMIFWPGYIPTRPDLTQNYSGLVYVEHCREYASAGGTVPEILPWRQVTGSVCLPSVCSR